MLETLLILPQLMIVGTACLQNKEIGRAAFTSPTFWRTVVELVGTHLKQA